MPASSLPEVPLLIPQGLRYVFTLRQSAGDFVYPGVTAVAKSAPLQVTAPAHGLPTGWTVKAEGPVGCCELLGLGEQLVTVVDVNTLQFNELVSLSWGNYAGGMVLRAHRPLSFAGATLGFEVRLDPKNNASLLTLSVGNGITIADGLITITLTPAQTALLTAPAVYRLTVAGAAGVPDGLLATGTITPLPWA